ncbi:bifunctional transcriptional activator/DNA repair enzyme AdaA [Tumebacillus permanentifrigoris]|uniref:AraC family transcriptional regulator of adaptative response / methylphosphotriester-DNA alkyltransferase methyltransferase n=1 Tax=Tumebacillus permanentifrigoris TaxID=378543 RepID=A0A316DFE4_9BACL|nr:bifunctional transcriptional activator/DNA repair enzyme AdaA [Tumebacillus permanentifrigoris]PWK15919.1 AraC family transcriptional regulator of adaptative response / methylphosphotriester-DNA alkyltransferase methyltransferase [Tumebacillus permanentifrigoris]
MDEQQWQAIETCDPALDGAFFYAVRTTGIYCRPSCKSRTPKRENVQVFGSAEEAIGRGFRACKRCRPEEMAWRGPADEVVAQVQAVIEQRYAESLSLELLAEQVRMNPHHVHRVFKRQTGQTPAEFLLAKRMAVAQELLRTTDWSVTEVAGEVGYVNLSHFSTVFHEQTGQTPTQFRGGKQR